MKPVEFEGMTTVFAKDQPQYQPLPAKVTPGPNGEVTTVWELTDKELEEVIRTKRISLSQWTFNKGLQPIKMFVEGVTE